MTHEITQNALYYGDNLQILRDHIPDESVDLVYLDPPFNSNADYNVLFKEPKGEPSTAQITAFEDTWHWGFEAERALQDVMQNAPPKVIEMMEAFRRFIGTNDMMAYLTMMAPRFLELHRILKPTGSLYLHCDPTASHYLKILLDTIFLAGNFQNEIIWRRSSAHSDRRQGNVIHMGRIHDVILFYVKTQEAKRNDVYLPYSQDYIAKMYRHVDEDGRKYRLDNLTGPGGAAKGNAHYEFLGVTRYWRYTKEKMQELYRQGRVVQTKPGRVPAYKRYLDEMPGVPVQDLWTDIPSIGSGAGERLGYPTQKPERLLERIISISSDAGDVVLDPFCGCGTAVSAAEKLGRRWIGIDVTYLAVNLMKFRLRDAYGLEPGKDYDVHGEPRDAAGARALAEQDRFEFEKWALSLTQAKARDSGKKGADKGIDGYMYFMDEHDKAKRVIVQVKSGKVHSSYIRDLGHTVDREQAEIGLLITLEAPTKPMVQEAAEKGFYRSQMWGRDFQRLQIITIEELLNGRRPDLPNQLPSHAQAQDQKDARADSQQGSLFP